MEKYGVACKCASGSVKPENMVKLASGKLQCPQCGQQYDHLKLDDKVHVKEKSEAFER